MQRQLDVSQVLARVQLVARTVRQSQAYPALIGGIAGGIAGALMAVLIAGRIAGQNTPRAPSAPREQFSTPQAKLRFDLSVREAIQLVTIVASLVKQIQAWAKERRR